MRFGPQNGNESYVLDAPAADAPVHDASIDAPLDAALYVCDPLAQTSCGGTQKCAWKNLTDPSSTSWGTGVIACAPDGTVALGGACTTLPAAQGGYDDCVHGTQCVVGVCEAICDTSATMACGATHTCGKHGGLFDPTHDGVCETTCDAFADNDFDNVGTMFTKTGTACGTDPFEACVVYLGSGSTKTYFACAHTPPNATLLYNEQPLAGAAACAPGYSLAFASDAAGSMITECYAMCKPGDAYLGNPNPQLPNGVEPHGCNSTDALGTFGAIPNGSADSNGEHCMYSWGLEQGGSFDPTMTSPTSNTVGWCFDHSKYKYDPTGGTNNTTVLPPCAALALHSTVALDAVDLACISTTTANQPGAPRKTHVVYIQGWPELFR